MKVTPQMPSSFKEFAGHVEPRDENCAAQLRFGHPLKQSELNVSTISLPNRIKSNSLSSRSVRSAPPEPEPADAPEPGRAGRPPQAYHGAQVGLEGWPSAVPAVDERGPGCAYGAR